MKKTVFFVLVLSLSFNAAVFSKTEEMVSLKFECSDAIDKKNQAVFLETITYWVKAQTSYKLSNQSGLLLSVYLRQKQDKYLLEASLKENDVILKQGHAFFNNLTDFTEALDTVFYKHIFNGKIEEMKRTYSVSPDFFDVALILDTTGSMKEETNFIKNRLKEILSYLFWNLKTYRLRLAFLDYKNLESVYRVKLTNFSEKTDEIQKHLGQIQNIGKGTSDINYALLYLLTYGNFIAPNRVIFVLTDTGPVDKSKFIETMQKAEKMKTRVVFLASDGISDDDAKFFESMAKRFNGGFYHLTYFLTYALSDYSIKNFVYQYRSLWTYNDNKETRDITLGRKIRKLDDAVGFIRSEGFSVQSVKDIYVNLGEVIAEYTSVFKKKVPVAVFQSGKSTFKVGIQDKETENALKKNKGKKLLIGGHFFPYFDTMSVFPYTLVLKKGNVPTFLIQFYNLMLKDPLFFYNKGIFEPSYWYVNVVFKGFE